MLSGTAALAAISLVGLTAAQCPNWVLAPVWFAIALLLAETGFRFALRTVRAEAHLLMLLGLCAVFLFDVFDRSTSPVIASYYYLRYRTILHNPAL